MKRTSIHPKTHASCTQLCAPKYMQYIMKLLKGSKPTLRTECPADSNRHKYYGPKHNTNKG